MLSGQQVPATIVDAVRLGAIDYVVKSDDSGGLDEAALEAAIIRALEHTSAHERGRAACGAGRRGAGRRAGLLGARAPRCATC